jgi:hypothetical protein
MESTLITTEQIPHIEADTPWKNILDRYLREFMEYCFPAIAANINWLIALPESFMIQYEQQVEQLEEQAMARFITTPERVGVIRGRQIGLEEGLEKGLQKELKDMAELIIRILRRRFSAAPPSLIAEIQQADLETLFAWGEKIAAANKIEDIS